jgi:hypothetical protein
METDVLLFETHDDKLQEAKAEAERKAKQAADSAAQQQQKQQQQQPAAASAKPPGASPAAAGGGSAAAAAAAGGDCKAAPGALEWEQLMAEKLRAAEESVRDLMTRPDLKAQRRQIEKRVTLIVSQIAGTQQQVGWFACTECLMLGMVCHIVSRLVGLFVYVTSPS